MAGFLTIQENAGRVIMLDGRIRAKVGFYERIIARMKNRQIVVAPGGRAGFRDIDVDIAEVEKIYDGLFDVAEILAEMIGDGYEDIHNIKDDITFMISDLREYTGINNDRNGHTNLWLVAPDDQCKNLVE